MLEQCAPQAEVIAHISALEALFAQSQAALAAAENKLAEVYKAGGLAA